MVGDIPGKEGRALVVVEGDVRIVIVLLLDAILLSSESVPSWRKTSRGFKYAEIMVQDRGFWPHLRTRIHRNQFAACK